MHIFITKLQIMDWHVHGQLRITLLEFEDLGDGLGLGYIAKMEFCVLMFPKVRS